jgi:hypothetical protein
MLIDKTDQRPTLTHTQQYTSVPSSPKPKMDASIIFVAMPHPSTPVQHQSEQCTTCVARSRRHQRRSSSRGSDNSSIDNNSSPEHAETNLEAQLALASTSTSDSNLLLTPPPPYSRRRRYQRLDIEPPTYASVLTTPPPGQPITKIPLTIRYIENLIFEADSYSKVICPTARKFKTQIQVYPSMAWDRLWECLRQAKPAVTMCKEGLREVKALRRKGKWERLVCSRLAGSVSLKEGNWEEVRRAICEGELDKILAAV